MQRQRECSWGEVESAGDFSFLPRVLQSRQDDFIQQTLENGGQRHSDRGRMSESTVRSVIINTIFALQTRKTQRYSEQYYMITRLQSSNFKVLRHSEML